MIDDPRKPRAYSYLRFSTPEQRHGDSYKRQADAAARYAAQHGLVLDDSLRFADEGVSAFRGKNASEGKLADFLEHVKSGEVPKGSYLLVENLDRITRARIDEAQYQLMGLMRSGIIVVTLMDGKRFEWGAVDMTDLIVSLAILSRGHEESETKSKRLKSAWAAKRAALAFKPLTSKCPAWLKLDPSGKQFETISDRAALINRIFRMSAEGAGQHKIATTLNSESVQPWGRASYWQRSYIGKILQSRAPIGTLVPHILEYVEGERRRIALEPVENYYPAVVEPDLFNTVQLLMSATGARPRGKSATAVVSNILAGMAVCPVCGRSMTRVQKGNRSKPSLVCTKAKAGAGCKYHSIPYWWIEEALLRNLPKQLEMREGQEVSEHFTVLADTVDRERDALRQARENLLDNMQIESSPALVKRLRAVEAEYDRKTAQLAGLRDQQAAASGLSLAARADKAIAAMQPEGRAIDRGEINRALKGLFHRAVINWPEGQIELEWTHGGICEVPYALRLPA